MGLGSDSCLNSAHAAEQFKGKRNTINNWNRSKKCRQSRGKESISEEAGSRKREKGFSWKANWTRVHTQINPHLLTCALSHTPPDKRHFDLFCTVWQSKFYAGTSPLLPTSSPFILSNESVSLMQMTPTLIPGTAAILATERCWWIDVDFKWPILPWTTAAPTQTHFS